jgi:hypothetical protein
VKCLWNEHRRSGGDYIARNSCQILPRRVGGVINRISSAGPLFTGGGPHRGLLVTMETPRRVSRENICGSDAETAPVVKWTVLLATNPEVPGSIPGLTSFSEKQSVWNGVHSASRG